MEEIHNINIEELKDRIIDYNSIDDDFIVSAKINNSNVKQEFIQKMINQPFRVNALAIISCIKGSFNASINLKKYKIEKNMCICNTPYNIFNIEDINDDAEIQIVAVSTSFIKEVNIKNLSSLYINLQNSPIVYLKDKDMKIFNYYLHVLYSVNTSYKNLVEIDCSLVASLLYWFQDVVKKSNKLQSIETPITKSKESILFEKFLHFLSKYYTKERSVSFYANKLNMAPKYFSTVIKEYSHLSASKWIDDYVILESKSLLKYSDLSIKQISDKLNFKNQSFFGKYFKNLTSMSPLNYRHKETK
jgi:AraC family transcriptional regulator, transcriptional activator of pobA